MELSAEQERALFEHWAGVFRSRPDITLFVSNEPPTEQELAASRLTTCRPDLTCSHDYFVHEFPKTGLRVGLRFQRHSKNIIHVRYPRV